MDNEIAVGMKFVMQIIGVVGSWMLLPKAAFRKTDDIVLQHYKIYGSRTEWKSIIEVHQQKVLAAALMIIYFVMSSGFALMEIPDQAARACWSGNAILVIGIMFVFKHFVIKRRLKNVNKVLEKTKQSV
ncbi:hypothetical protein [Azotosporobacter soli]|uniref:hypothetical protein n=1 Tax=Azotosporobacter soli TaxID=3055040 RepID=UPI0031FEDC77